MENNEYMEKLSAYYNKFNEDKRLNSRHGQVEFRTSMIYIHRYLEKLQERTGKSRKEIRILDIGAATGRYSIPLSEEGYTVTAVEPVKHNISRLRQKNGKIETYQADARNMTRLREGSYDLILLFGPMYHLQQKEDQIAALVEARRVTSPQGYIFAAYVMNEYAVLTYGFRERHIREAIAQGVLDEDFRCRRGANPLYHMVRLEDMAYLRQQAGLESIQIIAADGAANYMRTCLNALDEEEFEDFMRYHLATCERMELMGASAHTIDVLKVPDRSHLTMD